MARNGFSTYLAATGGLCALMIMAFPASADPKPSGARDVSAERIQRAYSGKTVPWGADCEGGIYLSPDKQARAWCGTKSDTIGAGTWEIRADGALCQSLVWFWPRGNTYGNTTSDHFCIAHATDALGLLLLSWPEDSGWWYVDTPGKRPVPGYKYQSEIAQASAAMGF